MNKVDKKTSNITIWDMMVFLGSVLFLVSLVTVVMWLKELRS